MNHIYEQLITALQNGDAKLCVKLTSELLEGGEAKENIILKGVHPAMDMMDGKCTSEEFNLLELMLTGRAVLAMVKLIYPEDSSQMATKETIIVAALEGDVHDLGKGIVKMALGAKGFRVVDCGKDASVETIIHTCLEENGSAICISGLISTVIPQVLQVKRRLKDEGRGDIFVLAGGAALAQCSKEELGVDFVGSSAFDALRYIQEKFGDQQ